jgi:hypothetical protein
MQIGNEELLLRQVCFEMGYPTPGKDGVTEDSGCDALQLAYYITGERREITYNHPEIAYFRDIVFMFKYMMAPSADLMPPVRAWLQMDTQLRWGYTAKKGYTVDKAFGGMKSIKCFKKKSMKKGKEKEKENAADKPSDKPHDSRKTLVQLLFKRPTRAGPSGADPTALVGTGEELEHEEDVRRSSTHCSGHAPGLGVGAGNGGCALYHWCSQVLHVPNDKLPIFNGRLSKRNSELLLSYLTVPYTATHALAC